MIDNLLIFRTYISLVCWYINRGIITWYLSLWWNVLRIFFILSENFQIKLHVISNLLFIHIKKEWNVWVNLKKKLFMHCTYRFHPSHYFLAMHPRPATGTRNSFGRIKVVNISTSKCGFKYIRVTFKHSFNRFL